MKIKIIPIHLLREDPRIKIADDGSKTIDTDDWQVDEATFQKSNQQFNFTLDLFASDCNKTYKTFYSNFYCPNTLGIDAFAHSWEEEVAWICPPIKEIIKVVRKLKTSKIAGVLFIPEWKTADYWVEIFDSEGKLLWPFTKFETCKPFIIQGTHNTKSPFAGRVNFNFLKIEFYLL